MVGEHDESIRPPGVPGGLQQRPDGPVDALERVDRLRALRAAVVRDGVVAGVVDVDRRRPAVHLLDDEGGGHDAQGDIGDGAFDSVVQVAMHPRLDGPAALALGLVQLLGHLADHQHEQADVVDGGDEEAAQAPFVVGAARASAIVAMVR